MTDHCPQCHDDTPIGVEVQGVYDGILFWACLDCRGTWHRFTPTHDPSLYAAAQACRAQFTLCPNDLGDDPVDHP